MAHAACTAVRVAATACMLRSTMDELAPTRVQAIVL